MNQTYQTHRQDEPPTVAVFQRTTPAPRTPELPGWCTRRKRRPLLRRIITPARRARLQKDLELTQQLLDSFTPEQRRRCVKVFRNTCGTIAFLAFFFTLGAVGGVEQDNLALLPGTLYAFGGLAVMWLFAWLAGAFK